MVGPTPEKNGDTPRWVKMSGFLGGGVALLILIMLFSGHGPGRHIPSNNPAVEEGQ